MDVCNMLQDTAQLWDHLLTTSGGKLNLGKCNIYIISWNFKEDGTPTPDNTSSYQIPITFSLDGIISYGTYLYSNEFTLYLGHSSQSDGIQQASFNILLNNSKSFARRVISMSMFRQQVTMVNNSITNPTIKYPLSITTFQTK